jgi:heterodisulfide reductase subunit C
MDAIKQTIKYDAERDPNFAKDIMATPGCEDLENCFQCGTCSGICPLSIYMDYTPRRIMNLARSGFKDEVLTSNTIWLCSSCYACTVECPKEIKITNIMYALKRRAIREHKYPKKFPIPVLAEEFFKMVRSKGRTTEGRLVMNMVLRTSPMKLLGMAKLGMKLLKTGRMSFGQESIRQTGQLARLLDAVETADKKEPRT